MRGPITSPRCEYRIRNPIDDSLVERAAIGDIVRHEWSCKIGIEADLCLVVTSCYLLTSDSKHHLINEQGCSTDASVLPELHYLKVSQNVSTFGIAQKPYIRFQCQLSLIPSENVSQNVSTFGIAQKPYIRFQCQLSLIPSENGTCQRPNCSMRSRRRKDVHSLIEADDAKILDAVSQEVEIVEFGHSAQRDSHRIKCNSATVVEKITSDEVVCISRLSFGIVAFSTILVALCTLLVVIISVVQRFHFGEIRIR
uniref:ZP domain-containing protein n=1 Tax=Ascaris lumbricoides TaxID=6252 RepID=A0A0M3IJ70_ASCLU